MYEISEWKPANSCSNRNAELMVLDTGQKPPPGPLWLSLGDARWTHPSQEGQKRTDCHTGPGVDIVYPRIHQTPSPLHFPLHLVIHFVSTISPSKHTLRTVQTAQPLTCARRFTAPLWWNAHIVSIFMLFCFAFYSKRGFLTLKLTSSSWRKDTGFLAPPRILGRPSQQLSVVRSLKMWPFCGCWMVLV